MWVLYLNTHTHTKGKEREKERESVLRSAGSVHRSLQPLELSWEPELEIPCLGSHMVGRDPATWTVTCCLSGSMFAGSWNWEPKPGSEPKYSKMGCWHLHGHLSHYTESQPPAWRCCLKDCQFFVLPVLTHSVLESPACCYLGFCSANIFYILGNQGGRAVVLKCHCGNWH